MGYLFCRKRLGGDSMATKSILKNINISDKKLAHTFVKALSEAETAKYKPAQMLRNCTEIKGDKIKSFFDKK